MAAMTPDVWSPELRLEDRAGRCRLTLVGVTYGNGPTLQDAANDLMTRLYDLALGLRANGFPAKVPVDPRVAAYLWEIGEIAVRGGDLRARVLDLTPH